MNREIKFRAWAIDDKKMETDIYVSDVNQQFVNNLNDFFKKPYDEVTCRDLILMQYTGLKDKNGVEIYEGDIVDNDGFIGEIGWCNEQAQFTGVFKLPNDDTKHCHNCAGDYTLTELTDEGVVVGNIYETPELLNN